jgi:hypothetical protein
VFEVLTVGGAVVVAVLVLFWFTRPKRPGRDGTNLWSAGGDNSP